MQLMDWSWFLKVSSRPLKHVLVVCNGVLVGHSKAEVSEVLLLQI